MAQREDGKPEVLGFVDLAADGAGTVGPPSDNEAWEIRTIVTSGPVDLFREEDPDEDGTYEITDADSAKMEITTDSNGNATAESINEAGIYEAAKIELPGGDGTSQGQSRIDVHEPSSSALVVVFIGSIVTES